MRCHQTLLLLLLLLPLALQAGRLPEAPDSAARTGPGDPPPEAAGFRQHPHSPARADSAATRALAQSPAVIRRKQNAQANQANDQPALVREHAQLQQQVLRERSGPLGRTAWRLWDRLKKTARKALAPRRSGSKSEQFDGDVVGDALLGLGSILVLEAILILILGLSLEDPTLDGDDALLLLLLVFIILPLAFVGSLFYLLYGLTFA